MKQIFLLPLVVFCLPLLMSACSKLKKDSKIRYLSHDYIVETLGSGEVFPKVEVDSDCNAHLAKILCVSDRVDLGLDENCSTTEVKPEQIAGLQNLASQLPPFHKKVMCHLDRIQIQRKIFSIAYASSITNQDYERIGNMIGIRSEVIVEEKSQTQDIFSWKEQLNFGRSTPNDPERKHSPEGPFLVERLSETGSRHLSTLIHELNHLIDGMNRSSTFNYQECEVTPVLDGRAAIYKCKLNPDAFAIHSWGESISFIGGSPEVTEEEYLKLEKQLPEPIWHAKWPFVGKLCYYYCEKTIPVGDMQSVYAELATTNFVSAYSTQSISEDFAESSTYYMLNEMGHKFQYLTTDKNKNVLFDGYKQFHSEGLKAKREWMKSYFAKDLLYKPAPLPPPPQEH